jgi:hypothetical protein
MPIDSTFYHGSPARPDKPAFGTTGNQVPAISPGRPFFITSSLPYALKFARGGTVSKVKLLTESIADLHDPVVVERLLSIYNSDQHILAGDGAWDDDIEGDIHDSAYRLLDSPDVMAQLIDEGIEAVFIPEDVEMNVKSYAILKPLAVEFLAAVRKPILEEAGPSR